MPKRSRKAHSCANALAAHWRRRRDAAAESAAAEPDLPLLTGLQSRRQLLPEFRDAPSNREFCTHVPRSDIQAMARLASCSHCASR